MSGYTRQSAARGPAAVAIHDDGYVQSVMGFTWQFGVPQHAHFDTRTPTYTTSSEDSAVFPFRGSPACGSEPCQSIPRVKYMAAAMARKLAIAPTSSALSSSRNSM